MAAAMRAQWIVAAVETPKTTRLPEAQRLCQLVALRLAEQLGAETVTLSGQYAIETILSYAQTRNVTKIVVGKPARPRWKEIVFGSTVDELVRGSGEIDVYVITGDQEAGQSAPPRLIERTSSWPAYGWGALMVGLCTAVAAALFSSFAERKKSISVRSVFSVAQFRRNPL
jgi:two-component system sensor histidine kinase KdpD